MSCSFDPCEAINIFIGGLVVSALFALLYAWLIRRYQRKRFGKIHGHFNGFSKPTDGTHLSIATVTYVGKNNLEISVNVIHPKPEIWRGFVNLYSEEYGKLEFIYEQPEEKSQIMGEKFIKILSEDHFNLKHKHGEGYGNEYFIRDNSLKEESTLAFINRIIKYYFGI
jgi:hypothetical protein